MKVSVETLDGCGVKGHHHTCLCDVVIDKPTPIRIKDAVHEMWMGPQLCDIRDYGVPWKDEDILNYLQDLLKGHDAWTLANASLPDENDPSNDRWDGRQNNRMKYIRSVMRQTLSMNDPKPKVADILHSLGFTAEEFTTAISTGKYVWDMKKLCEFETTILSGFPSMASLARDFDLGVESCSNLFGYWGVPYTYSKTPQGCTPETIARMNELFAEGRTNKQVSIIMESEYGYILHRFNASKARARYLRTIVK